MSGGLSALAHIKPISNEFGIRGRMPRYRLGRYGPHSNDALLEVDSPSDVVANASIKVQNMSRISGNIAKVYFMCGFAFSSVAVLEGNQELHTTYSHPENLLGHNYPSDKYSKYSI